MTKINPGLSSLMRSVADLKPDAKNARKHSKRDLEVIAESLSLHGQQKPIVVLRDGTVIAGNGTLAAARALGWTEVAAVEFDSSDTAKARAFAIVDNRSAELSEWDFKALSAELKDLPVDLLAGVGFTDYELTPLLSADWEPAAVDDAQEFTGTNEKTHTIVLSDSQWAAFMAAAAYVEKTWPHTGKPTLGDVVEELANSKLTRQLA